MDELTRQAYALASRHFIPDAGPVVPIGDAKFFLPDTHGLGLREWSHQEAYRTIDEILRREVEKQRLPFPRAIPVAKPFDPSDEGDV